MAENRVIGRDGGLPWHIPGDLKFFKQTTTGHAVLFGRTTFEGIGRPLPGRENLVLSRDWAGVPGVRVLRSLEQVQAWQGEKLFICGGAEIYRLMLPLCSSLLLTRVAGVVEGDTFMPRFEDRFDQVGVRLKGEGFTVEEWSACAGR